MTINLSVTDKGEDQDYIDDDQQFQQNAIEDDFSDAISESSESSINDDTDGAPVVTRETVTVETQTDDICLEVVEKKPSKWWGIGKGVMIFSLGTAAASAAVLTQAVGTSVVASSSVVVGGLTHAVAAVTSGVVKWAANKTYRTGVALATGTRDMVKRGGEKISRWRTIKPASERVHMRHNSDTQLNYGDYRHPLKRRISQ